MTITVTLLLSSGDPDPTWVLSHEEEQVFHRRLAASPVPNTSVAAPSRRPGYAGIMARDGGGERWIVHRGWIRGGVVSRVDDRRALEQWLLSTGVNTVPPKVTTELTLLIAPPP